MWFKKILAAWDDKDYDAATHVENAFVSYFPEHHFHTGWPQDESTIYLDSRPETRDKSVFYGKSIYNPKYNQTYQLSSLVLICNGRTYRILINNGPLHNPEGINKQDALLWIRAHGFSGDVARTYDSYTGPDLRVLKKFVGIKNPLDLIQTVESIIYNDKRDDDGDDDVDSPEPWPPETSDVDSPQGVLV